MQVTELPAEGLKRQFKIVIPAGDLAAKVDERVTVRNYGDAINVRDGASNWAVRGAHTSMIHDDCLQDDFLNAGVIDGSLFDGCYVGISTRASSGEAIDAPL